MTPEVSHIQVINGRVRSLKIRWIAKTRVFWATRSAQQMQPVLKMSM